MDTSDYLRPLIRLLTMLPQFLMGHFQDIVDLVIICNPFLVHPGTTVVIENVSMRIDEGDGESSPFEECLFSQFA
jgi:hypothetical protein